MTSDLHKKHKKLKKLKARNIVINTICIIMVLLGISWTVNYFWKYVNYEITND
ncbi:MAG: HlyD family secretion protein, partial [Mucinivorans sp.]